MKSKIVIFRILAAIIAVGGAFASVSANSALVASTAYVNYTTSTDSDVQQYCTVAGTCNTPGQNLCMVTVVINGIPSNVRAKRFINNACSVVQFDNDSDIDGTKTLPATAVVIAPNP